MMTREDIAVLHGAILHALVFEESYQIQDLLDSLAKQNRELHDQDNSYYGFLIGKDMYYHRSLAPEWKRQTKRRPPHPKIAAQVQIAHNKLTQLTLTEKLVKQAIGNLYRIEDDRQHIRDVIPDNLMSLIEIPSIALPSRSIPEEDIKKMGPTGANFSLIQQLANDAMVRRLLKG